MATKLQQALEELRKAGALLEEAASAELEPAKGVPQASSASLTNQGTPSAGAPATSSATPLQAGAVPGAASKYVPPMGPAADGGWPKILEFAQPFGPNVQVLAEEPIDWRWKPPMSTILYSQQGHWVFDPSNGGKLGMPRRSQAGFPLFYAIASDGHAVGTPSVLYGEAGFNSDAEVLEYIARCAAADAMPKAVGQTTWADVNRRIAEQVVGPAASAQPPGGDVQVEVER